MRLVAVLAAAGLVACTAGPAAVPSPASKQSPPTAPSPDPVPVVHPVSLPALFEKEYDGRDFTVRSTRARGSAYTEYAITFRSGRLRISGLMFVPVGEGPFPVLVLAHGYIDPAVYTTGRGFETTQDWLARRGYAVVHVDYRNHATSDDDPRNDLRMRLGYTEDVINAARAVKSSGLDYLDVERIGLLGRSMGGGVALNVAVVAPDLFDAIVTFAPVSSDTVDNFNRWINRPGRRALAREIIDTYGSPRAAPEFWANASPRTFFERVRDPIQIHHGTDDESCPVRWSHETFAALKDAGARARLHLYPGEGHAFGPAYGRSMTRAAAFFDRHFD